jgi:formyltetrahydrofolate synthetase
MIETIRENEENKLNEMRNAFESTREETKNRNVEELETMKQDLIKKIEALDASFEVAFNRFVSETNQKAALYEDLLTNNQKDSDQINMFQRQINRLKEQTTYLTMKINQNKKECDERNTRVKKEKDSIVSHYH